MAIKRSTKFDTSQQEQIIRQQQAGTGQKVGLSEAEAERRFGSRFRELTTTLPEQRGLFVIPGATLERQNNQTTAGGQSNLFTGLGQPNFPDLLKNQINSAGFASNTLNLDLDELGRRNQATKNLFEEERGRLARSGESAIGASRFTQGIQAGSGSGLARSSLDDAKLTLQKEALDRSMKELKSAENEAIRLNRSDLLEETRKARADRLQEFIQLQNLELSQRQEERTGRVQEAQLSLGERKFEEQKKQFDLQSEQVIAGLTGSFRGSPTFEAEQATLNNILDISGLTGMFNNEPTLEGRQLLADLAFEEAQLTGVFGGEPTLQNLSLQETIRSNQAREALSAQANAISASKKATAKLPLTQRTLNILAAEGIPNEESLAINNALANSRSEDPIGEVKSALELEGIDTSIIDRYIKVITQPTTADILQGAFSQGGDEDSSLAGENPNQ